MKILFVSRAYYPSVRYGGPVIQLRRTCDELSRRGHDVTVVCSNLSSPGMRGKRITEGEQRIGGARVRFLDTPFRYRWDGISLRAKEILRHEVRRADVMEVTGTRHYLGWLAIRSARSARKPYVIVPEGSVPPRSRKIPLKQLVDLWHTRGALESAFRAVATSEGERQDLIEWGLSSDRLVVLPPLVERPLAPRNSKVQEFAEERRLGRSHTVVWMGRIHPEKGLPLLFEAIGDPRLKDVQLLIAGDEEDRRLGMKLRDRAGQPDLNGRVTFLGWLYSKEKFELLASADLLALPSRKENYGMAAAEALAVGVPVVVTETSGIADVVRDRAGLVCKYEVQSIADGLAKLLDDDQLRWQFGRNAPSVLESIEANVLERHEGLLQQAVDDELGRTLSAG